MTNVENTTEKTVKGANKTNKLLIAGIVGASLLGLTGTGLAVTTMYNHPEPAQIVSENVKLTIKKAEQIATKEVTNSTVLESKLIKENNVTMYDVKVQQGTLIKGFKIDANTGKILETTTNPPMGYHGGGKHGRDGHMGGANLPPAQPPTTTNQTNTNQNTTNHSNTNSTNTTNSNTSTTNNS